jgi:HlyD family secretion protein
LKIAIISLAVLLAVVITGAILVGPALSRRLPSLQGAPSGTPVRSMAVEPRPLVEKVTAPGAVEPHTKVVISSQVSARIEQIPIHEGDEVRKDELVVKLDDRDLRAALEAVEARLEGEQFRLQAEQARRQGLVASLEFARKELQRKRQLFATGDISPQSLDAALEQEQDLAANLDATNYAISVIESSLTSARADIKRAEDALAKTVILAPMDGVVTQVNMEVGEQVLGTLSNMGSPIMTIADLTRMIVKAEVPESDVARVADGQRVQVHLNAYPGETFSGTVTKIALQRTTSTTDGTGVFETEVEIDLQGRRIRSGLAANVDIEVATHQGLVVETQAIVDRLIDDLPEAVRSSPLVDRSRRVARVAYRMIEGKAVCTPVRAGASDLTHTMVLEGLSQGDRIIIGPYKVLEKLADGQAVREEAPEPAATGPEGAIAAAGAAAPPQAGDAAP